MGADRHPRAREGGTRFTPAARDAALELVRRVNRWMIAGAVAASGVLSLVAANASHSRTIHATSAAGTSSSGSSSPVVQTPAPNVSGDDSGLQAPVQPPIAAPSGVGPVVSSGGS